MRRVALLINCGRSGLVDEVALVEALLYGEISVEIGHITVMPGGIKWGCGARLFGSGLFGDGNRSPRKNFGRC